MIVPVVWSSNAISLGVSELRGERSTSPSTRSPFTRMPSAAAAVRARPGCPSDRGAHVPGTPHTGCAESIHCVLTRARNPRGWATASSRRAWNRVYRSSAVSGAAGAVVVSVIRTSFLLLTDNTVRHGVIRRPPQLEHRDVRWREAQDLAVERQRRLARTDSGLHLPEPVRLALEREVGVRDALRDEAVADPLRLGGRHHRVVEALQEQHGAVETVDVPQRRPLVVDRLR